MKKIKKKNFNHLENFLKRILKNGKKYKFFKILKSLIFLLKFLKLKLKLKLLKIPSSIFIEKKLLLLTPRYSFKIIKKKKKKFLDSCIVNNSNTNELFKWWRLSLFKIKIRTIKKRIAYFLMCFYLNSAWFTKVLSYSKKKYKTKDQVHSKKVLVKPKGLIEDVGRPKPYTILSAKLTNIHGTNSPSMNITYYYLTLLIMIYIYFFYEFIFYLLL